MLDRRLLSVNITISGIATAPANNPAVGTQYIVAANPTGDFANATAGSIATYDGSRWVFTAPRADTPEVLNITTSEILKYNGTEWETVTAIRSITPVIDILPTGDTLPATASVGDQFLNINDAKLYTATEENTWDAGVATSDGDRYASSTDHKIYENDDNELKGVTIVDGTIFLNRADNYIYVYDNNAFIRASADPEIVTEIHSLTSAEVTAKSFNLSTNVRAGQEDNTLLFVCGVSHPAGTAFSVVGNVVSWENKTLDAIGLLEGDELVIQFIK